MENSCETRGTGNVLPKGAHEMEEAFITSAEMSAIGLVQKGKVCFFKNFGTD